MPETFKTADEMMTLLSNSANIPVHMEVLRRGYFDLPPSERKDLVVKLLKRYDQTPDDAVKFFDFGYAQLVYLNNKSGLFFLRKANDRLKNQFTSLAYAMGQAEVDLSQEKSPASEMTMRKLDVIHKLSDAVAQDVKEHQPGFWPSYVRVVQKLGQFPVYQDYTKTDFSLHYVPVGQKPGGPALQADFKTSQPEPSTKDTYALAATQTDSQGKKSKKQVETTHQVGHISKTVDIQEVPIAVRSIPNTRNLLKFYKMENLEQLRVVVTNPQDQPILSFISLNGMDVLEDLDKDSVYELITRQYRQNPFEPIRIYRLTSDGYELDQAHYNLFL